MALVGYLVNTKQGLTGDPGSMYNYILASNGVFVRGENEYLKATVPIQELSLPVDREARQTHLVRGLLPLRADLQLTHGLVPDELWQNVYWLLTTLKVETFIAILWEKDHYRAEIPLQLSSPGRVKYATVPGTMIEVHSHPDGALWFSSTDDDDELGLGVYGVACRMADGRFQTQWRVGIYGQFQVMPPEKIFQGGVDDVQASLGGPA